MKMTENLHCLQGNLKYLEQLKLFSESANSNNHFLKPVQQYWRNMDKPQKQNEQLSVDRKQSKAGERRQGRRDTLEKNKQGQDRNSSDCPSSKNWSSVLNRWEDSE